MLSISAVVNALPVPGGRSPPVITFVAANTISDIWDLEGTVTDNGKPVAGLKVDFGGVLSSFHVTATVEEMGRYSVTEELRVSPEVRQRPRPAETMGRHPTWPMTYIIDNDLGSTSERRFGSFRFQ